MHGCGSGSAVIVYAEVDSMGGVVDSGDGIGIKTSLRLASVERALTELRQEYDVREERRRELEFLEKGGNPLDFKTGIGSSLSVQSTSLTDQHPEHIVTSEAKDSFVLTASPYGDSVESSGRPGIPTVSEPNTADNLSLLDGENVSLKSERKFTHSTKKNCVVTREHGSQLNRTQNAKESEYSAIVRPYARRNRSKTNRDSARSSSAVMIQTRASHRFLPTRGGPRDAKSTSEVNNQKEQIITVVENNNQKSTTSNGCMASKFATSDTQLNMELDGVPSKEVATNTTKDSAPEAKLDISSLRERKLDVTTSRHLKGGQQSGILNSNSQQTLANMYCEPDLVDCKEEIVSATTKINKECSSSLPTGFCDSKRDATIIPSGGPNSTAEIVMKAESSCTQNSLTVDVNNDSHTHLNTRVESNEIHLEQASELEAIANLADVDLVNEKNDINAADVAAIDNNDKKSLCQNHSVGGSIVKVEEEAVIVLTEAHESTPDLQNGVKYPSKVNAERNDHTKSETDRKVGDAAVDNSGSSGVNTDIGKCQRPMDIPVSEPEASISGRNFIDAPDAQMVDKAYEDSILEKARIIEAKQKRIAELSVATSPLENRRRTHWYFVLEEMAWLANDFAQERLWKMTVASQISRRVALTSRLKFEAKAQCLKLKNIAYTLAKDVMRFWHSAEILRNTDDPSSGIKSCSQDVSVGEARVKGQETLEEKPQSAKSQTIAVQNYAVRFLTSNNYHVPSLQSEAPATPVRMSDFATAEISWDEYRNEESLFYAVPSGAMESYRKTIESHLLKREKTASIQEEVETSTYDAPGEMGYHDTAYDDDEDEGETSAYYLSGGFEGCKSLKSSHKKRKNSMKSYNSRTYETGTDFHYGHCTNGAQQSVLTGKRPASTLHVGSFPTKRVRTASRQRIVGPFNAGATGCMQVPMKTDASSGDTNSFQDDQNTLHGGSRIQKSMEVESAGNFEKQLPYDCAETSIKPKKKKKVKTLGTAYALGWQLDTSVHIEQRDHSRKRLDSDHFESNGTGGSYGQHGVKKPKIMKQQVDSTFDNMNPIMGSIPSPTASQMSNMPNPNKLIKLISGRDRGRKTKGLKADSEQHGSGSPWLLFEDQALVVLVHDMGPNWEFVSDAMNSTLQFKCIYRKPKECKERHKILMDRTAGDGADSAEDSGSSQSYTLPGIPKGSARQLFRRLQGPMEEDTLRSHFEKIILIGKKLHQCRRQNENQDSKKMGTVHNSHLIALSQVCSNNLNGGLLMPLDLCDAASSPDGLPFGYHGSHTGGAAIANQGGVASIRPSPVANPSVQVTSDMLLSNSLPSPSGSLTPPMRDGRYNASRTPLPVDEQQRMQPYNQMFSARSLQQANLSAPGADRAVRMLPGGNGVGMMVNRSMPMPRPGFRGIALQPGLNSGSMLSSSVVGMPSPVNIHSGAASGQGKSVLRPQEALHMMRLGQNAEHQRQLMAPELQMPAFNGLRSGFSSQTASSAPVIQTYQGHPQQLSPQQSHVALINPPPHHHLQGPNHQYAARLAKQQRYMQQQQQQQFASSSPSMQHAKPQAQLPLPNNSQIQPQTASVPPLATSSPMTPMSSHQPQKHHLTPHGLNRNPKTVTNQMGKQRQRQLQQLQQSGRQHPQQQRQQQAKFLKGTGNGSMSMHQNLSVDPTHLNGISTPPETQSVDKGDQIMHLMPGPGLNPIRPSKPLISPQSLNHAQPQPKLYSAPIPASKPIQQNDNSSPSQIPAFPSGNTLPVLPVNTASKHQHLQPHQRQRMLQQNCQVNSDSSGKSQLDHVQAEQPLNNNVSQMSTSTTVIPPASIDSTDVAPVSSAIDPNWKASEPEYNCGKSNVTTQSSSNANPPRASSTNSDSVSSVRLGQRQVSGSLPSSQVQYQQQDQPLHEDQQQSPQQLPLQQETQQQMQPL